MGKNLDNTGDRAQVRNTQKPLELGQRENRPPPRFWCHINKNTTDKEILEIQEKYVEWRKEILAFFKDNGYDLGKEEFSKLFSVVGLFGRVTFLDEVLDLNKETKYYFPLIESYIKKKTILKN